CGVGPATRGGASGPAAPSPGLRAEQAGGTVLRRVAPIPPQGLGGAPLWDPTAIPAATVIVVREPSRGARRDGLEVLMLRRDSSLSFAAGAWVFPGGRIDPED